MAKKKSSPSNPMAPVAPNDPKDGSDADWEANNALDDMLRVERHKANTDLMKRINKVAGRKQKALTGIRSLQGLRDKADDMYGLGAKRRAKEADES